MVICLSTTVRNDTLQDAKEQRVSVKCRKQLRVEEVEMVRLSLSIHSLKVVSFLCARVFSTSVKFCPNLCSRRTSAWSRSCTTPVSRTSADCVPTWLMATHRSAASHTLFHLCVKLTYTSLSINTKRRVLH